jgi:hypothetical protein
MFFWLASCTNRVHIYCCEILKLRTVNGFRCDGHHDSDNPKLCLHVLECVWKLMLHVYSRVGKWRGNWRMEWVAIILTLPRNVVYPALLPLMRTPRLPAVDWTDAPADLNGLVRFGERRSLVSARVSSRFKRTIPTWRLYGSVATCLSRKTFLS